MSHYPVREELIGSGKDPMMELKRSPRSMLGLLSWGAISLLFVLLLCYFFADQSWIYILLLAPTALTVEAFRRYHDDLYIFEREKITHQGGRLSLQYSVPAVRYIDIRAITVNQSFMGRIFDYGDLELNTAAQDAGELYIEGIRAPDDLGYLVEEIRAFYQREAIERAEQESEG